jgi:hypothetical protein
MSTLSSLPDEVLKLVMQHVPLKERLSSSCLVSRRMHAAATTATQELQLAWGWPNLDKSLEGWLFQYGQHVTCMYLRSPSWPLLQLPCPNLQKLVLWQCMVQLGEAADGKAGVLKACTKLTCLVFGGCFADAVEGSIVDSLSSLVHLQHLDVRTYRTLGGLSVATLPRLQHLTHLDVQLSAENHLQLGGLTTLQQLHLHIGDEAVRYSNLPGFVLPASLRKLVLQWPNVDPEATDIILAKLEAGMLSVIPTTLQELQVECLIEGPAEGPDSWLCNMAHLQHLTKLLLLPNGSLEWPPVGPAYSALTASSHLVHLEMYDAGLPDGAWSYMFPAAHKLPHLTSLRMQRGAAWLESGVPPRWTAAETSSLVSCCPSLCEVTRLRLQLGPHVSELHKLTALTRLHVMYEGLDGPGSFEESMRGLAAVTQLLELDLLHVSETLSVAALLPLTSLTALNKLKLSWRPPTEEVDDEYETDSELLEYNNNQVSTLRIAVTISIRYGWSGYMVRFNMRLNIP